MTKFIQLHLLTSYPPSNLNRDDLGRPKTATMGGTERLRVSSQSLKRTWRTSDVFENELSEPTKLKVFGKELNYSAELGYRSKGFSEELVKPYLLEKRLNEEDADAWSKDLCRGFGVAENEKNKLSQLAHIAAAELHGLEKATDEIINYLNSGRHTEFTSKLAELVERRNSKSKSDDIKKANEAITKFLSKELLSKGTKAVDIALFGRMLASSPEYNIEAACQVAHGISVHSVAIEDDYFTAVDDLNSAGDQGAAHIGEAGFAAALFYSYICIDKELLVDNLDGDVELATKAVAALTEAAVKVSPKGKQNTFASRAYASYVLAEKGAQQPRSLSVAFLEPIHGNQQAVDAIAKLTRQVENFDKVYGDCADSRMSLNAITGEGDFNALKNFIAD